MMKSINCLPPQLRIRYVEKDLKGASQAAQDLLSKREFTQLNFNPSGEIHFEQAKRFVVMGLAVQNKFDHLFTTEGLPASVESYDKYISYVNLLNKFPDPLKQFANHEFEIAENNPLMLLETRSNSKFPAMRLFPIDISDNHGNDEAFLIASAHAIIDSTYERCIELTGNRPRNFQMMHKINKAMGASIVRRLTDLEELSGLIFYAEFFHPLPYFVIDALLINPETNLPFNINISF